MRKFVIMHKSKRHFCDSLPINKVQAHLKLKRSQIIRAICREFLSLFYKGCDIERGNSKFSLPRFHYLIRLGKAASSHDDINVTLSHKEQKVIFRNLFLVPQEIDNINANFLDQITHKCLVLMLLHLSGK